MLRVFLPLSTQFSYGIADDVNKLKKIKKALESKKFLELINYCKFTNHKYDYKVIKTFKKDFYLDFQDDDDDNIDVDNTIKKSKKKVVETTFDSDSTESEDEPPKKKKAVKKK